MTTDVYETLRKFLDQFPVGVPKSKSGTEIKILKRLFTEEEAEISTLLSITPKTPSQIARGSKYDKRVMAEKLEGMAMKGLIFRVRRENATLYNSAPLMIGLYEYSVNKIDKELAQLYRKYYDEVLMDEIGASDVPGFKVLPINEYVDIETVSIPYLKLVESVKTARKIAVAECICRKEAKLLGEGCNHPIENCLSFGIAAEFYIENGWGREITADEAIKVLKEADEAGLVHAGANTKHLSNICNCCPCCCVSMKGITKKGYNKHKYMNALFESEINSELCTGCKLCLERCPVGAIKVEDFAQVDKNKCLGCGVCAISCPNEAISLHLRYHREEAFNNVIDLGIRIIEEKREKKRKHNG